MANVLKLLRNNSLYASRAAALEAINTKAATLGDGEFWTATYGTSPNAKSIIAYKRNWGLTIIDLEGIYGDIATQIQTAINNFSATLAPIAFSGSASDAGTTALTETSTHVAVSGTNVPAQIESLATSIKTVQSNAGKYKVSKLTPQEVSALEDATNVKEAYKVVTYTGEDTTGTTYTQVGVPIKIYKDSSLKEVYIGASTDTINATTGVITKNTVTDPQSMNFAYQLADGTYELVKIDVSKFLTDAEYGVGLERVSGSNGYKIQVKKDSTSESFLSITTDGVKISGVQTAINNAVNNSVSGLDAVVYGAGSNGTTQPSDKVNAATSFTNDTTNKVVVKVTEVDGKIDAVDVKTNDIASAADLAEVDRVTAEALTDLDDRKADKTDLNNVLTSITAGNGINVGSVSNHTQTVSVKLDAVQTDNALTVGTNGLYLSKTINCGEY